MSAARPIARRRLLPALLMGPLVLGLAACGRRGRLRAPEGREEEFTYPHRYPRPETVLPEGVEALESEELESEEELDIEEELGGS